MRAFQSGAVVRIDGMPLVFAARLCGLPITREHRVTWVDWIHPLLELATSNGWTVFYCGATDEVLANAHTDISRRYPSLRFLSRNGYFSGGADEASFVTEVNRLGVDVLIVGMGMPRQEQFVLRHSDALDVPVVLTSGAAIEYVAGAVRTPPRWMGRMGLEWFFRLALDPRRFASRYLVEPWTLLPLLLRDIWRYRIRGDRQ